MAFGLIALHPVLDARFVLVDDHEILTLVAPMGSTARPPIDVRSMAFLSDPSVGRFRPLYWTVRLSEVMLFADNAQAWHATMLGLGIVAAGLLFGAARAVGANTVEAFLLAAWILVAPGVSSLWVRLGADDTLATALLVLSGFAAARRWDVLFVLAAAACFLSKEAFALTAPALAALRTVADGRWRPTCSSWVVLALGVLETLVVLRIGAAAGPLSYGGRYLALPGLGSYLRSLAQNAAILAFVGVAFVVPLVIWRRRDVLHNRAWLAATAIMVVLVGPQLVLYSQQGIFEGKYEGASAVGVAAWVMTAVALLRVGSPRRLYQAALGLWAITVGAFGFSTWTYASAFRVDSQELARLVEYVAASAPRDGIVFVAGDPARQYEPIVSLADHIAYHGRGDVQVRTLSLPPTQPYTPLEQSFADTLASSKFEQPPFWNCDGGAPLIVLGDDVQARTAQPCIVTGYARMEFSSVVPLWGGDAVSLRPRLPGFTRVGYVLYEPTRTSRIPKRYAHG